MNTENPTLKPMPIGRQMMQMLVTPNAQGQHWASEPSAGQLFTPDMVRCFNHFMDCTDADDSGQPMPQTLHSAMTELVQTALVRRITGTHSVQIKDLLGDVNDDGNEEAWAMFLDGLRDVVAVMAFMMTDMLDEYLPLFIKHARKQLDAAQAQEGGAA